MIRWSSLKVKEATDMVEEIVKPILEPLEQAKAVVAEAEKLPNLPDYMKQRLSHLEGEIKRVAGYTGSDWVKGKKVETFHKGYIFRAIDAIRENLPKGDLAKEQAQFQKWLDLFDGDKEKAQASMDITRPEPKQEQMNLGYNPVGEAIEFVNRGEIGGEEPLGEALSVASEEFAEDEELQEKVGNFIDRIIKQCSAGETNGIAEVVAKEFNLIDDDDLVNWIEEYLGHWNELHQEVDDELLSDV